MNLLHFFKEYLTTRDDVPAKATIKNYLSDVRKFIVWFEETYHTRFLPQAVTATTIEKFKADKLARIKRGQINRGNGFAASSVDRYTSSLRKFFLCLKENGLIVTSPFDMLNEAKKHSEEDEWAIKAFKNFLYLEKASDLTIKNYIIDVRQFLSWAEAVTKSDTKSYIVDRRNLLEKITPALTEEYKNRLLTILKLSPISINRKLSAIRKYLTFASKEGLLVAPLAVVANISETPKAFKEDQILSVPLQNKAVKIEAEDIPQKKTYSSFPPLRLLQKLGFAGSFLFDLAFIAPLAMLSDKAEYLGFLANGGKVFSNASQALPKLGIDSQNVFPVDPLGSILNSVPNFKQSFYDPSVVAVDSLPLHKRLIHHIRYTRPNWYKRYHSYTFVHYIHFAAFIVAVSLIAFGAYQWLNPPKQAGVLASTVGPPRVLSFQGRLTDKNDNPITAKTNLRFGIYSSLTASGSALLWQEVNGVTPNEDGIFSVLLGSGTAIPQSLFAQNASLYVGISVGRDKELNPRQQIATVAYASNADVLQGMPPITQTNAGTTNVILALDSSGNLTIGGTASPTFQATGGTFTLSGNTLQLTTTTGSNGNVVIAPNGTGLISMQSPIENLSNGNTMPGISGAIQFNDNIGVYNTGVQPAISIYQTSSGNVITASQSGNTVFTVNNTGQGYFAQALGIGQQNPSSMLYVSSGGDATSASFNSTASTNTILSFLNNGNQFASINRNSNGDLQTVTNGTANIIFNPGGNVGIGMTTAPTAFLVEVAGNVGPSAANTYNLGSSSLPWNTIYANNLSLPSFTNVGGVVYVSGSGTLSGTATGSSGDCLVSQGTSSPVWTACAAASGATWTLANGALYPNSSTADVLIGGTSTASAKIRLGGSTNADSFFNTGGNVGIGTTDAIRKLTVYNSNSTPGQWVAGVFSSVDPGNPTVVLGTLEGAPTIGGHNAALTAWETLYINTNPNNFSDSGTSIFGGNVGIGEDSPATKLSVRGEDYATLTEIKNSQTGTTNDVSQGLYAENRATHSSGSLDYVTGIEAVSFNMNDGDVSNLVGIAGSTFNDSGSGTVSNMAALYGFTNVNNGGTVTNNYGLYLADQAGVGASNYQIYSAGSAPSYFAGNVGIGTSDPGTRLDVSGGATVGSDQMTARFTSTSQNRNLIMFNNDNGGASTSNLFVYQKDGVNKWSFGNDLNNNATQDFFISDEVAGQIRFFMNSDGNVGLGTSTPSTFKLQTAGSIGPNADNTYDLGSSPSARFRSLYLGPGSLHIQCTTGDGCGQGTDWAIGIPTSGAARNSLQFGLNRSSFTSGTPALTLTEGSNVGIGNTLPTAKLSVGSLDLGGTAASDTFTTNAGSLSTTAGTELVLGSIGFTSGNMSSLGIRSIRTRAGSDWTTTAIGLGMDVDNTARAGGASIWLNSVGNVGIGTTAPGAVLGVDNNLGNGGDIFIASKSGTTLFKVNNQGNVGIGTTNPGAPLAVSGNARFMNSSDNTKYLNINTGDLDNWVRIESTNSSGVFAFTRGEIESRGADAAIRLWASGTTLGDYIDIRKTTGYGRIETGLGDLILSPAGNVGIGTTTPELQFHVSDSIAGTAAAMIENTQSTGHGLAIKLGFGSIPGASCDTGGTCNSYVTFLNSNGKIMGKIHASSASTVTYKANGTDFAEYFVKEPNEEFEAGDVISLNNSHATYSKYAYDPSMIGVVSDAPSFAGGEAGPEKVLVGMIGQVPVKIVDSSSAIKKGDPITSSPEARKAMRAQRAGRILGLALEDWEPNSGKETIKIYLNPSWHDPDVYITDAGVLSIEQNTQEQFEVKKNGQTIDRVGAFAKAVIGSLEAGVVSATEVSAESITIAGMSLRDYIISIVEQTQNDPQIISPLDGKLAVNVISPLSSDTLVIDGKLTILSEEREKVVLDVQGSASIAGAITASDASISGTVTAQKVEADELELSEQGLSKLKDKLGTTSATIVNNITNIYQNATPSASPNPTGTVSPTPGASPSATPTPVDTPDGDDSSNAQTEYAPMASMSGVLGYIPNLKADFATFTEGLISLGPSSLNDVSVAGNLSVNGNMLLAENSINVLGADLQIQPLRQGNIAFMGGLIRMDIDGNLTVNGNASFGKKVAIKGLLETNFISPIPGENLVISLPSLPGHPDSEFVIQNASGSGVLRVNQLGDLIASGEGKFKSLAAEGFKIVRGVQADTSLTETVASSSAGTAIISKNLNERTIVSPFVKEDSLIYITPLSDTAGLTPYVARQTAENKEENIKGSFTIQIPSTTTKDIKVNWWIVN